MSIDQTKAQQKLDELLFIEGDKINNDDLASKTILMIHAINLSVDMQCTGLLEDDPENTFEIPPNWQNPIAGVYSLRYKFQEDTCYFKFINENNFLSINFVIQSQNDKIFTLTIYIKEIDCKNIKSNINKSFIIDYEKKILKPIFEKIEQIHKKKQKEEEIKQNEQQQQQNSNLGLFWNKPRNDPYKPLQPNNMFGEYGKSDLEPIPINQQQGAFSPFQPLNINPMQGGVGSGNLFGPNNPIFGGGLPGQRTGIRQDPFGPDGINGSFPDDFDEDVRSLQPPGFNPMHPFGQNQKKGGKGGFPF